MENIDRKDFDIKFKEYLDEHSSDKPSSFFGTWAWYETKKKEFETIYSEQRKH
jgi:hypothetical protein